MDSIGRDAIETCTNFIHDIRRKRVSFTYNRVDCRCALVSLIECTPVCNTWERARNDLGVIGIANAPENAVLITEVVVDTNIELIHIVADDRIRWRSY